MLSAFMLRGQHLLLGLRHKAHQLQEFHVEAGGFGRGIQLVAQQVGRFALVQDDLGGWVGGQELVDGSDMVDVAMRHCTHTIGNFQETGGGA